MDELGYVHTSNSAHSHSPGMTRIHTQRSRARLKPKPGAWALAFLDHYVELSPASWPSAPWTRR